MKKYVENNYSTTKKQPQTNTVAEAYNDNSTDTQDMDISTTLVSDSNDVTVIARAQRFMAVNEPSPRAKPEDKVCLLP